MTVTERPDQEPLPRYRRVCIVAFLVAALSGCAFAWIPADSDQPREQFWEEHAELKVILTVTLLAGSLVAALTFTRAFPGETTPGGGGAPGG